MADKSITNLTAASSFVAADQLAIRKNGETEDKSLTGTLLGAWIVASVLTNANHKMNPYTRTIFALIICSVMWLKTK